MGASVGKKGFVSEINVTPFVDVMLVLLIIFMVTAPMMDQGLDVDLPQTKQVDTLPINRDGTMFLDKYEVRPDELETRLGLLVRDKGRALFLRADQSVPYGVVVDVMGRVKAAGIDRLGVIALPDNESASGETPAAR